MIDPSRTRRVDVRLRTALETGSFPAELLIEGPAGTGKTFGILAFLHTLACQFANLRILLCRQTRASLTESVLATYEEDVLPAFGHERIASGQQRKHRSDYHLPNGSRFVLGGLDKPDRILSTAWDAVFLNEAIEAQEDAWDTLSTRLARPGRDSRFGFLVGDTNPGDPSHWLNKRCDADRTSRWQTSHAANPTLFDRTGWTPAWDRYRERLDRLRGTRRKRLYQGLWASGEGVWFGTFDRDTHVSPDAAYDRRWPVHLWVDTGVHTGAVWAQVREAGDLTTVTIFGEYYSYDVSAYDNAVAILDRTRELCGRFDVGRMDPSGGSASGFGGVTIESEFRRAGLNLQPWISFGGSVVAGLTLVESFVATDPPALLVHPSCTQVVNAFANYKRARRGGQYVDRPEDPQHPYEDLIDPIRSGLLDRWPEGRRPEPKLLRVPARRVI